VKLEWKFCLSEAVPKLQFWNSFLRFRGKPGFRPVFPRACPKLTEFWNKLIKAAFSTGGENAIEG
jgi:hypothetical protein